MTISSIARDLPEHREEVRAAKTHLKALGTPGPDMPPFDEPKYGKMPEAEINLKDDHRIDPYVPLEALLALDADG